MFPEYGFMGFKVEGQRLKGLGFQVLDISFKLTLRVWVLAFRVLDFSV